MPETEILPMTRLEIGEDQDGFFLTFIDIGVTILLSGAQYSKIMHGRDEMRAANARADA